jgi:hypothetical protein
MTETQDPLPFAHVAVPSYLRMPSGLDVPCDGPKLLALDENNQPICAECKQPVYRTN